MKNTLEKWGYAYTYYRTQVKITGKPETPEEKLKEILIRKLNLDVQINIYAFACFICAFRDIDGFESMPWGERERQMKLHYHVDITERTLRSWCSKLIAKNTVWKSNELSYWKTVPVGNAKYRTHIEEEDTELKQYFQKRNEYLRIGEKKAAENGLSNQEARTSAWNYAYTALWNEFKCCYFPCKLLCFNAISDVDIFEIYKLVEEIGAAPVIHTPDYQKILTEEDFHQEWYHDTTQIISTKN